MATFNIITITLIWIKFRLRILSIAALIAAILGAYYWFRDLERERRFQGKHTQIVQGRLKWGLTWFLFREVWFFFRVFWRFFHARRAPITSGNWNWPGEGLFIIPPFQVPLLNTVILLMRGVTATLAHQELLIDKRGVWISSRVLLGTYFLFLQYVEYKTSYYTISSGVYGRVFFFGTGFHGLHVCLGVTMLIVSNARLYANLISSQHHFGLEFRLWYWHFVDVVWLFLFFWVYMWGS